MLRSLTDANEAGRILSRAFAAVVSRSSVTVDVAPSQHEAGVMTAEGQA
jgi:hypothetical protein